MSFRVLGTLSAVAHNTFREAIRDKVLFVILFFGLLALAFSGVLAEMALYENVRLVRDVGLAGANLLSIFVATFLGVTLLHKEIDRRTIEAVLPKPIARWEFIVGKYVGLCVTMFAIGFLLSCVVALLLLLQASKIDGALIRALVLSQLEVIVITAVATVFSSWTRPFLSGLFTLGVFALGRAAEDLVGLAALTKGALGTALKWIQLFLPSLNLFYVSGYEVRGVHVSIHGAFVDWTYVGQAGLYALAYVSFSLALSILLFQWRDFV